MMNMRRALFLLSSARADDDGNSVTLACAAAADLPQTIKQQWIALRDCMPEPFIDTRHGYGEYPPAQGNTKTLLDATMAATDIVIAMPLYWYALPALVKAYLEQWSAWTRIPSLGFKDAMRYTAEFLSMRWGCAVVSRALKPGDVAQDMAALKAARQLLVAAPMLAHS
jgi:hypothetical protein